MYAPKSLEFIDGVASPWSTGVEPNGGGMAESYLMPMTRCRYVSRVMNREALKASASYRHTTGGYTYAYSEKPWMHCPCSITVVYWSRTQWRGYGWVLSHANDTLPPCIQGFESRGQSTGGYSYACSRRPWGDCGCSHHRRQPNPMVGGMTELISCQWHASTILCRFDSDTEKWIAVNVGWDTSAFNEESWGGSPPRVRKPLALGIDNSTSANTMLTSSHVSIPGDCNVFRNRNAQREICAKVHTHTRLERDR